MSDAFSSDRFYRALGRVLAHEAGYVDHPRDPGGATNMGITRRTLAQWRGIPVRDLPKTEMRALSKQEAARIYKAAYWDALRCDDLPAGLDYAMFDFAVNSGPARAARFLQKILGVRADGIIGGLSLRAIARFDVWHLISLLMAARLDFLRRQPAWDAFGRGWSRRIDDVTRAAYTEAVETAL